MTNAAPFIASPTRRLLAGAVDLSACMVTALVVSSVFLLDYSAAVSIVYAAYHAAFFWLFHGQTPGIFSFNMRIARSADGADMPFGQALVRAAVRPLAVYMLGWAAVRPLALYVAGWSTSWEQSVASGTIALVTTLLAVELGMMFTLATRQTLSDIISKTLVLNVPPPQPHRAPAAPMYSPSDAEFGVRPRRTK
jgi:uncharacterized RDD family membrane protein YckC